MSDLPIWFGEIRAFNHGFRYYTWVKHLENSGGSKAQHAQKLEDVERGRDREEHGLVTIFEAKDEADEETVTLGHWSASASRKTPDKA